MGSRYQNVAIRWIKLILGWRRSFGREAIIVPEDTTIVLEEGSVNVIQSTVAKKLPSRNMAAISCEGNITFEGTGSLEITGQSKYGVNAILGSIIINNGNYIFSGINELSFLAGENFVLNQGDIEIADGQISIGSDFIINGGKLATNENFFPVKITDGTFILNDGCVKIISNEDEAEREFQISMSDEHYRWIINGGELYAASIYTDSSLTVNDGYIELDGDGLNIGTLGQYIQHGGMVVIRSDYQGIDNQVVLPLENRDKERFIITEGNCK